VPSVPFHLCISLSRPYTEFNHVLNDFSYIHLATCKETNFKGVTHVCADVHTATLILCDSMCVCVYPQGGSLRNGVDVWVKSYGICAWDGIFIHHSVRYESRQVLIC
jgi:hypothetical protein